MATATGFSFPVQEQKKQQTLSFDQASEALDALLNEFRDVRISKHIDDARKAAGGTVEGIFVQVIPLIYEVQGHVMEKYGFEPDDDGFTAFAKALTAHESGNAAIAEKAKAFKALMRQMTSPTQTDADETNEENVDDSNVAASGTSNNGSQK